MRSDVLSYYASIDHHILYNQFCDLIESIPLRRLVWQYLKRTVNIGENYVDIERGISLGCPLSPLMSALYLKPLDDALSKLNVFYTRFMDDWVILTNSRHKLKRAIKIVNQTLTKLKVEKHPDKTFIGRTNKGFTFLGYTLKKTLSPAPITLKRCHDKIIRPYERGGSKPAGDYLKHWVSWPKGGLDPTLIKKGETNVSPRMHYILNKCRFDQCRTHWLTP